MEKQNPLEAFMTFCKDFPKAAFVCHACMIFAVFAFIFTGKHLARILAESPMLEPQEAGTVLTIESIVLWFIAFILGVKARPMRSQEFVEYPPTKMLREAWSHGILIFLGVGAGFGYLISVGIFASLLAAFLGMLAIILLITPLFAIWITITAMAVKRTGDSTVMIADSYHRSWWFSGATVGVLCLFLQWAGGETDVANFYIVGLHGSLVSAVYLTGFASGYYP